MPPLLPGDPGDGHGEDDHDDVGYVAPLPPEDRLWRHPSEVASGRAVAVPSPRRRLGGRTASLVALSAMAGAIAAVAAVALLGGFDERVVERQVAVDAARLVDEDPDVVAAVTARTAGSVAAVRVQRGEERHHASAVAFRSDGYLLTDGPSVAGADGIDVVLRDGWVGAARVVGIDEASGIAVLHLDGEVEPAALADGDGPIAVGARAVVVGASMEGRWDATVSAGVVSAVGRRLEGRDGTVRHGMILMDEPFAPGTAGGALVDGSGAVVGIVSGEHAGSGGATFGVATPIDLARHVAEQIIEDGRAHHVWLGLRGTDLDISDAVSLGVTGGAVVEAADHGGPAQRAGIEPGDVIVSLDGEEITTMSALIAALRRHVPGDVVALGVRRDGEVTTLRVTLAAKG